MSDCNYCPVEKECYYPYKPCDCVHQRKFWSKERREEYDASENLKLNKAHVSGQLPLSEDEEIDRIVDKNVKLFKQLRDEASGNLR